MRLWRICRRAHTAAAFSGEGARLYGGRWNSQGVAVVYTSPSLALAAVETFVYLEPNLRPDDLVSIAAEMPDDIASERLDLKSLSRKWYELRVEALRTCGDSWLGAGETLARHGPSAAIRDEWNGLLNPEHPDFRKLKIE